MKTHKSTIQIRFGDTDMLGHVNNARYLSYFELARIQFFNYVFGDLIDWKDEGILLANSNIDFIRPILLKDEIEITTWISKIGSKSFTFSHEIKSRNGSILFSKAQLTVVCVSYQRNVTIEIPKLWKEKLLEFIHEQ